MEEIEKLTLMRDRAYEKEIMILVFKKRYKYKYNFKMRTKGIFIAVIV